MKLEERAKQLVEHKPSTTLAAVLQAELSLHLDHLRQAHDLWQYQQYRLLLAEVYVDEELLAHDARVPRYSKDWLPERLNLLGRLSQLDSERRQHHARHVERKQGLELRLLDALHRAELLK